MNIQPYLTFSGNCREAMTFYQEAIGGQLEFQTLGQSPFGTKIPCQFQPYILRASLTKDGLVLIGTDIVPEQGLQKGNAVSLMLNCSTEQELWDVYAKLADEGRATYPPTASGTGGTLFGNLTDKFGNHWLLNYEYTNR
jgi:PhnB protein